MSETFFILVANIIYTPIELHIDFLYFLCTSGLRQKPTPSIKPKQILNHQHDGLNLLNYEPTYITKNRFDFWQDPKVFDLKLQKDLHFPRRIRFKKHF